MVIAKLLLPLMVSTSFLMSDVTVKGKQLIESANISQRLVTQHQKRLVTAIESYQETYGEYPKVAGQTPLERWEQLQALLIEREHFVGLYPHANGYDYKVEHNGFGYKLNFGETAYQSVK